jgi:CheY-like chemotaxis protein
LKTTVLLVEDNKSQRLVNTRILHKAGYTVLHADDGEAALRVAREQVPNLILLDMLLPKLGGPEVLHALKQDPVTAPIPVIVLSSLPQVNAAKLRTEGAADYFEKSRLVADAAGPEAFFDMVEKVVRGSGQQNQEAMPPGSLANRH